MSDFLLCDKLYLKARRESDDDDFFPHFEDLERIWEETNMTRFIFKMHDHIYEKTTIEAMVKQATKEEDTFLFCSNVITLIDLFGFQDAFLTFYSWLQPESETALRSIGADKASNIFSKAYRLVSGISELSIKERHQFIKKRTHRSFAAEFEALSQEYTNCQAETKELLYRYAHNNSKHFRR